MTATDIISLDSAKSWLSVDENDDATNAEITRLIGSAIAWVEKYTSWRTYQRTEVVYNRQENYYNPADYFPDYGTGFYTGSSGIRWTPRALAINVYPFTVTSVQDQSELPKDVSYTLQRNTLKTLLYAAPNSVITLQTGFASADIAKIPSPLLEATYKLITYLYENRDMYKTEGPTDVQVLLNQYRRGLI